MENSIELVRSVAQAIYDKKGFNIIALDVRGVSLITDFVVIAEGAIERHVIALAQDVIRLLKSQGQAPCHVEGLEVGDWVVVDDLNLMIHIMTPSIREKYQLEEIFREGKLIDLKFESSKVHTQEN